MFAENVKGILERQWCRNKKNYDVETVVEFTYLGYKVCVGGRCEAAVIARTRCGWVMYME